MPARIEGSPGNRNQGRRRVDYSGVEPHPADEVIEWVAWIMDNSIPLGGGYTIGLDPLIGLIPGLGDVIGALVSGVIVVQAHRAGVSRSTIARMTANIAIDAAIGAIPVAGDLFDFTFKANSKNLELYRKARAGTHSRASDYLFLAVVLLAIIATAAIPIGIVWLLWHYLAAGHNAAAV